jgi:uncharacterized protein YjbI with pentapeptide repeats
MRSRIEWLRRRHVPRSVAWFGVVLLQMTIFTALLLAPRLLYPPLSAEDLQGVSDPRAKIELRQAQFRLSNESRTTFLQVIAGVLVIAGAAATWRQVFIAREGQITERFTRAVDQIGSDDALVRVGGIYALERIAKNSPADRDSVQFVLAAFVRAGADWPVGTRGGPDHPTPTVDMHIPWLRVRSPDVAAAMGALGRRLPSRESPVLYLSRVDLRCVALRNSRFSEAKLRHANLARAVLINVDMTRADLTGADLRLARLQGSNLGGAILCRATLHGAVLTNINLEAADLRGTDLRQADLEGAVLNGARADDSTLWPDSLPETARRDRGVDETLYEGAAHK